MGKRDRERNAKENEFSKAQNNEFIEKYCKVKKSFHPFLPYLILNILDRNLPQTKAFSYLEKSQIHLFSSLIYWSSEFSIF